MSAVSIIESLAAPFGVAVDAAERRLAVSWSPVDGATGYKVAVRLKNGVEPFDWSEYEADSPPYVIAEQWTAMSGLEYEVRAASVNAEGQSAWSDSVSATAPALRPAPAGAIAIETSGPYAVGDVMRASLRDQMPFDRRSLFVWSVCDPDGRECELLPLVTPTSYLYLVPLAARGKRAQVQADYDKDGVSYTATATLGVVSFEGSAFPQAALPPGCEGAALFSNGSAFTTEPALSTHLHYLESWSVQTEWDGVDGGAIEPLCNDLLVASPWGNIALARSDGRVEQVEGRVPMNLEGLRSHPNSAAFSPSRFRVADILLRQRSETLWELFVTHHYFTGECVLFRLSSTTILMEGGTPSLSPSWKTVFDADPCLDPTEHSGQHAGGRMLTDGPDHLLIVVGDHNQEELPQHPGSHLGKLVRVDVESGAAEILALGLRNPQGLARDADGNLWETEHGPRGGDELNLLEPGGNYGWPIAGYGTPYDGYITASEKESIGKHEGFEKPRFAWTPGIGVSAIVVNDKRAFPLWEDDLLVASLSGACQAAECAGHALFRIRRDGQDIQYAERIEVGHRIRDLTQTPDGRLALLADDGRVHFISPSYEPCADRTEERLERRLVVYAAACDALTALFEAHRSVPSLSSGGDGGGEAPPNIGNGADAAGAPVSGAQLYAARCEVCHSIGAKEHDIGPHLVGLIGRRIGEADGWNSSEALRALGGVWTRDSLARFLEDPQGFAPGTTMGGQGLSESEAGAVADYIAGLRGE